MEVAASAQLVVRDSLQLVQIANARKTAVSAAVQDHSLIWLPVLAKPVLNLVLRATLINALAIRLLVAHQVLEEEEEAVVMVAAVVAAAAVVVAAAAAVALPPTMTIGNSR